MCDARYPEAPDQFIEVPHAWQTFRRVRKSFCHGNWAEITFASQRKWILQQIKLEITFGKFSNWHCRSFLLTEIFNLGSPYSKMKIYGKSERIRVNI